MFANLEISVVRYVAQGMSEGECEGMKNTDMRRVSLWPSRLMMNVDIVLIGISVSFFDEVAQ